MAAEPSNNKPANAMGRLVFIPTTVAFLLTAAGAIYTECVTSVDPQTIHPHPPHSAVWHGILITSSVAIVFGVFCIFFGIHWYREADGHHSSLWLHSPVKVWKVVFLVPWVILPPVWYCAEYFVAYHPPCVPQYCLSSDKIGEAEEKDCTLRLELRKNAIDELVQGQDNTAKIWLAMVTLLAGLYFGRSLGEDLFT